MWILDACRRIGPKITYDVSSVGRLQSGNVVWSTQWQNRRRPEIVVAG